MVSKMNIAMDVINPPYKPAFLLTRNIGWGISVDLDLLASKRNWGLGDFTDLRNLVAWAADQGASFVKVSPLFEKSNNSSSTFISNENNIAYDPIYLDIETVADFDESLSIQRSLLAPEFQKKIAVLKEQLDHEEIRKAKLFAANHCYKHFCDFHIKKDTVRVASFRAFQKRERMWLRKYAIFKAWQEIFAAVDLQPNTADLTEEFVLANNERVEYFEYVQWLIDVQLTQIGDYCLSRHMPVGLCLTLAESEPNTLRTSSKEHFLGMLQMAMLHAGAINISSLLVIENSCFFANPDEILDMLVAESQRLQCLVIIDASSSISLEDVALRREFAMQPSAAVLHKLGYGKSVKFPYNLTSAICIDGVTKLIYFELGEVFALSVDNNESAVWQVVLEQIGDNKTVKIIIDAMKVITDSNEEQREESVPSARPSTIVPRATYRIQLNKEFNLKDAIVIVPYLAQLGISHCYTSPFLKANAGSMHGYDIVNHNQINPEIGSLEDFDSFVATLKEHGMGLVVDIVPNHMSTGSQNMWWQDVLENGTDSIYSDYFDIDWQPIKRELSEKVLLPILGEPYGKVVKSGQLKLCFNLDEGSFKVAYFDNLLPLNPLSYPYILDRRLDVLKERLGTENENVEEYLSILDGFSKLKDLSFDPSKRFREQRVQMKRLHELCKNNARIAEFIGQNLQEFNVDGTNLVIEQRLHELLEQQAYRLSFWRVSSDEINYRRFFDIDSLAAVRMEDPRVFAEAHHLIFKLIKEGKIEGLRIDHPDGLFDPAKYFEDLQQETTKILGLPEPINPIEENIFDAEFAPFYIVIEKILAPFEHLSANWKVHGTVGYDYLNAVLRLMIDAENKDQFEAIYESFIGEKIDLDTLKLTCKELILNSVLASELNVLAHKLGRLAESSWYHRDFSLGSIRGGLEEVIKYFPVYRTYINRSPIDKAARGYIDWALHLAKKNSSAVSARVYDFLYSVLTLDLLNSVDEFLSSPEEKDDFLNQALLFVMRFQQYTGPVMAKSIEDTMFYRYNRFIALNEVGGEPDQFGSYANAFHFQNQQRQQKRPYEMLSTSTHDTKRSEDVRARLAALSEIPEIWQEKVTGWQRMNKLRKTLSESEIFPDSNDEYLIYQTLVGVLPVGWSKNSRPQNDDIEHLVSRVQQYILKAVREAKIYTSWINPNESYEQFVMSFVKKILSPVNNPFFEDLLDFHESIKDYGLINSLVQTVLKLTSPGIPDIYQNCEFWDFSLVDPDNRKAIDLDRCRRFLSGPSPLTCMIANRNDGQIKYFITQTCLQYRQKEPELFTKGKYIPLEVTGPGQGNVLAYMRVWRDKVCLTAVPLKAVRLLGQHKGFSDLEVFQELTKEATWAGTTIQIPNSLGIRNLQNIFSKNTLDVKTNFLSCVDIFRDLAVAVFAD